MRRFVKAYEGAHLLCHAGVCAEVLTRDLGKTKLCFGRKFPCQIKLDALADGVGVGQELGGGRLFKFQKHVGAFDLDPLAAVQLHLHRGFCLGQDAPGNKFASFFKQ